MRSSVVFILAFLTAVVNAHFQTKYPPPRGPFNAPNEIYKCDGYSTPATNRTQFPLRGGYLTFSSGHKNWTAGLFVSTSQNVTGTESNFGLHNQFYKDLLPGNFCLPLDFSQTNVTGLSDGLNITIQVIWNGGDGPLYQCSDVTLVSGLDISSTVPCENRTSAPTTPAAGSAATNIAQSTTTFLASLVLVAGLSLL